MADDMTPEQIAELQKKNCIFCKIIAGEIESKKVFEDDNFLAILDIRPAAPGHTIVMPKDHIPLLPLLPEEKMIALFSITAELASALQDAMISQKITVFIASGYVAGQQAPHAMIHLIPRDKGDGLDALDVDKLTIAQQQELAPLFQQATTQVLLHRKRPDLVKEETMLPSPKPVEQPSREEPQQARQEPPQTAPIETPEQRTQTITQPTYTPQQSPVEEQQEETKEFEEPSDALQEVLTMSPDLRNLIIAQPDLVSEYVKKSPKLAKLFEGVNIRALSLALQKQRSEKEEKSGQQQKPAAAMSEHELFQFIDINEGLRAWILDHPDELTANITQNPKLASFFANIDIKELSKRYRSYRQTKGDA